MDKLAEVTGLSKSYLSQIENGEKTPTIGTLTKIAFGLGANVVSLISGESPQDDRPRFTVVRSKERRSVVLPGTAHGYQYESVSYKKPDRVMDAYVVTAGPEPPEGLLAHDGQELVFMLEGKQEMLYDGQSHVVEAGDVMLFDSDRPHCGRSLGDGPAKFLVVFCSPPKE